MAKKLSFDKLPEAVGKVLEILSSEGTEHTDLSELVQRMALLEKKIDCLQKTVSPDKPVMEMQTVCKVLRLRPKAVNELSISGVLPSHTEGRRTLFYEDAVVKYFMTQPVWKEAVSKPSSKKSAPVGPAPATPEVEGHRRVDISGASEILGRSTAAVYQLTSGHRVPFHKEGAKIYFFADDLREWVKDHPARKRKAKTS